MILKKLKNKGLNLNKCLKKLNLFFFINKFDIVLIK
jgi:hypothetical protein